MVIEFIRGDSGLFEGIEDSSLRYSKKANLDLPRDLSFKRDHPILSDIVPLAAYAMIPLALMLGAPDQVRAEEGDNSVFAASLLTQGSENNVVDFKSGEGDRAVLQHNVLPWDSEPVNNFAGSIFVNTDLGLQVGAEVGADHTGDNQGASGFGGFKVTRGNRSLETHLGAFESNGVETGSFLHAKFLNDYLTIDGDVSMTLNSGKETPGARGYASMNLRNGLYFSAGGNTTNDVLTSLNGFINEGGLSVLARARFDLENESQLGILSVGDEGRWTRGKYDFFNRVHNETLGLGMGNKVIPKVSVGWPPFDFQISSNAAAIAEVYNDPKVFTGSLSAAWAALPGFYVVGRGKLSHDKNSGEVDPKAYLGMYLEEGGKNPFGFYAGSWVDPKTGESSIDAFVGFHETF